MGGAGWLRPSENEPPHESAGAPQNAGALPLPDLEAGSALLRWSVHVGLPVSASLVLHSAVALALLWASWNVFGRGAAPAEHEIRLTEIPIDVSGGSPDATGHAGLSERAARQPTEPPDFGAFDDPPLFLTDAQPSPAPGESDLGGFGLGDYGRSGPLGLGDGAGSGGGAGLGEGFGAGEGLPGAGVWGLRAEGRTFVYVVDFSGSIVNVVDDLRRELKRSIGRLKPTQMFNVILFYGNEDDQRVTENFAPQLLPANEDSRRRVFRWLDQHKPQGGTDALPGLRRAFAMRPEAVFFFSDGLLVNVPTPENEEQLLTQISDANARTRAQIHCLVFDEFLLAEGPSARQTPGSRLMERIAARNRGKTKIVTAADLR